MNRWGPNSKEMAAIKKYLDTQNVTINASNHPCVSGVEIDLPALYHAVQSLGGLTEVIQKVKFAINFVVYLVVHRWRFCFDGVSWF